MTYIRGLVALGLAGLLALPIATAVRAAQTGPAATAPAADELARAVQLVQAERYQEAVPILEKLVSEQPGHADAWSELGFSRRKLGRLEGALHAYGKALAIEPLHRGANEYLGELYVELGDIAKAKERLAVLERACGVACEEYRELEAAIAARTGADKPS